MRSLDFRPSVAARILSGAKSNQIVGSADMDLADGWITTDGSNPMMGGFFDPTTKKWTKKSTGAATCKRGFVQFIYEPIKTIIESAINDNKEKLFGLCDKLGISSKIKSEDRELVGKPLMKR